MYQIDKSQSNHNMYLSSVISIIAWCFFFSNLTSLAKFSVPCAVVPTPGGFFVKSKTSLRRGKIIVEEEEQILGEIKNTFSNPHPQDIQAEDKPIFEEEKMYRVHISRCYDSNLLFHSDWKLTNPNPISLLPALSDVTFTVALLLCVLKIWCG